MIEIRRADGELCGHVRADGDSWLALTVFGGRLGVHDDLESAQRQVLEDGLRSLADRWRLIDRHAGDEQVVCIQEAGPDGVTLALDYFSMPGVPTLVLTRVDLTGDRWDLRLG